MTECTCLRDWKRHEPTCSDFDTCTDQRYRSGWKDGLEAAITIVEARRDETMGDDLRQVIDTVVNVAVASLRELMTVHDPK